jgi:hypothetical protein
MKQAKKSQGVFMVLRKKEERIYCKEESAANHPSH